VFPPGLLIGQVAQDPGGRLRTRLAADYERLEFLRVLRDHGARRVSSPSALILPETPPGITDAATAEPQQ
jgi:rod shape-determining protein MreC